MLYQFRYFFRGCAEPALESGRYIDDRAAVVRAASELLRMSSRTGVQVFGPLGLVYERRRREVRPASERADGA